MRLIRIFAVLIVSLIAAGAVDNTPVFPLPLEISRSNNLTIIHLPRIPGIDAWALSLSTNLDGPFVDAAPGELWNYLWNDATVQNSSGFFRAGIQPMPAENIYEANLLHRIGYGPTPDDLERIKTLGEDTYLAEQLSPELIQENLDFDQVDTHPGWKRVTATGPATSSTLYIYLKSAGDCHVDDIKLVAGSVAEAGVNLIKDGGFEAASLAANWTVSSNLSNSTIDAQIAHSGNGALHVISTSKGDSKATAIWQTISGVTRNKIYTLSYWQKNGTNIPSNLIVRLSGSGITSSPENLGTKLALGAAISDDLRAWHTLHAIRSKKQLLEAMLQFLDNHFVTEHKKSREYMDKYYSSTVINAMATTFEYKEIERWRKALSNPGCSFYDLLKISAESPAMIIYLDTVDSKGNGSNIANENYARELLELFTFGVDNGYDQNDITVASRAWTGWSVNIVDRDQEFNPLASRTKNLLPNAPNNGSITNLDGVWTFNFKSANHNTAAKAIFEGKIVPDRFGAPWAGKSYELLLPSRTGTNGIKDGYDLIAHLANQPFTEEFISVKLCRLFVHEDFAIGYDFTSPELSPEGKLVHDCMMAWENSNPKGKIRPILETIFKSDLFKQQSSTAHKVKTPFEYCASAIRALRAEVEGGFTADSDGYSLYSPMDRMGRMRLFDREEPDGYPEGGPSWISAGTLAERLRFTQSLLLASGQTGKSDAGEGNRTDPVKLLKSKLPQAQWKSAESVADYFLRILFPGEGRANLAGYKNLAIEYLNTDDSGASPSPFSSLADASSTYDSRVRGLVAMLMTLPRFQEQ
jgi:uncharacterized protein (DUF1800 family)